MGNANMTIIFIELFCRRSFESLWLAFGNLMTNSFFLFCGSWFCFSDKRLEIGNNKHPLQAAGRILHLHRG
jgi:hypothetical protein